MKQDFGPTPTAPLDTSGAMREGGLVPLYRPSNGAEAMSFAAVFCDCCLKQGPCPIAHAAFWTDEPIPAWQYGPNDEPICTEFEVRLS